MTREVYDRRQRKAKFFSNITQAENECALLRLEGKTLASVHEFIDLAGPYWCVQIGRLPEDASGRIYWLGEDGKAV